MWGFGPGVGDGANAPAFGEAAALAGAAVALGPAPDAAGLLAGSRWSRLDAAGGRTLVTYSFADAQSQYALTYGSDGFPATLGALGASDRAMVREALATIEAVCNLRFVEVADHGSARGDLRIAYSQVPNALGFAGFAFFPSAIEHAGDVWLGAAQAAPDWDFYRPSLMLHEILHALGLRHPSEDGTPHSAGDVIPNTVMSYAPLPGIAAGLLSAYPSQPMLADVAALQLLYGAAAHNGDDTTYALADPQWRGNFHTIWDSGGIDVLDASGLPQRVALDLRPGARSDIGDRVLALGQQPDGASVPASYLQTLSIAAGAVIEQALGSAFDDVLQGNDAANVLRGGAGSDTLYGGAGDDTLDGGAGGDMLDGGDGTDTAQYAGALADYAVSIGDFVTVRDLRSGDTDTLRSVERLAFADGALALDLQGRAGTAAGLLGALAGTTALHDPQQFGTVLAWLDDGVAADQAANRLGGALLAPDLSHQSLVELLYRNVIGGAPDTAVIAYFVDQLDTGALTPQALIVLAGDVVAQHLALVGVAADGLAYAPAA